jgi:hypothetical protein
MRKTSIEVTIRDSRKECLPSGWTVSVMFTIFVRECEMRKFVRKRVEEGGREEERKVDGGLQGECGVEAGKWESSGSK